MILLLLTTVRHSNSDALVNMSEIRGDSRFDALSATLEEILEGDVEKSITKEAGDRETNDADEHTRQSQEHGTPPTTHLTNTGASRTTRQKGVFTKLVTIYVRDLYGRNEIILLDGVHEGRAYPTSTSQNDMACP